MPHRWCCTRGSGAMRPRTSSRRRSSSWSASGRPPEDVVAWLYRVVRNGALDAAKIARRRQRRESAAARPVRWFVEPEVDGLDAETAVAALERLVPEQREVIVAHHWGGLSFEQIAAVVGCSASTAFRRYTAGVEVLRKQLGVTCPNRSSNA